MYRITKSKHILQKKLKYSNTLQFYARMTFIYHCYNNCIIFMYKEFVQM